MAKKTTKKQKENSKNNAEQPSEPKKPDFETITKQFSNEEQEKIKSIQNNINSFKDKVVKRFQSYVMGVAILPPPKEPEQQNKDKVNVLVLVDDSDSQNKNKEELKQKLSGVIQSFAEETDKNIMPQTMLLSELWNACYDSKYEVLQLVAMGGIIYDTGMLAAVKVCETHKSMVLKKFEKYIVSYVLAGSLVQGKATPESDIDVWVVIDDTDVKKMSRAELKDKLRSIIIGMGIEAGEYTGVKNKLNIQVYILTDFWDSLREANPVIFTFLRDGVPFYDRGIFMPWKNLLKMGRIKPSDEAIDMFMHSGEQMLQRVEHKLKEIGMEDTFWAILTPSQAALMLYGVPPPTPKETPEVMREVFVKKEKLLEEKYVKILENNIKIRKDTEHGNRKKVTGKEVDKLLKDSQDYLERVKTLFDEISQRKEKESIVHIYDTTKTLVRDALKFESVSDVKDEDLAKSVENYLVRKGQVPDNLLTNLKNVFKAKDDYDAGKLTKAEVAKVKKESSQLTRTLVEYMQRKRGRELERAKIRFKYGERYGEVMLLDDVAFIIEDIDSEQKTVQKAKVSKEGKLSEVQKSSLEEFESYLAKVEFPNKVFIKQPIFDDLKELFGQDIEIQVNY